ncbi:GDSL-like Lipase/Acylhydrolase family protein [Catalinimonas alkaloidigena]|uniref:GDSL-like Lipase/Acylhydrolase family protein n=1 Tax=Catalinimonas alkaloidigena TaxID=1075417 RepID=A0A1G9J595_9BACT|nr:SGNH/GDSL hydrolase family protein [Catalinimonas alkaloidigena]SDL32697.1 GDSL-like Lipase/Acylhydrolase family protein [Catalinimonas alkaloidigena]
MNAKSFGWLWLVIAGCSSVQPATTDEAVLPASALYPVGRSLPAPHGGVELIGSAVHVGFRFAGDSCRVVAHLTQPGAHNYLQYELDGVYQKRIRVADTSRSEITIQATGEGPQTVWLYKATEAHTGPIILDEIVGQGVRSLKRPEAPFIEFIGNSITCGAAADPSEVPCGTGVYHDQHNAYQAYGPRVARALGVNYLMSCVSGIGVYRNWNSDGPTMPQVYEKADLQQDSERMWEFDAYRPAVVSIALGTNDYSNGDGQRPRLPFDPEAFVSHYVAFVQQVKAHYPEAQIALLSSPMVQGGRRDTLQQCLTAVKTQVDALHPAARPVALYFFEPMQASGCTGHPSVEEHARLAEELRPFFRKLLQHTN